MRFWFAKKVNEKVVERLILQASDDMLDLIMETVQKTTTSILENAMQNPQNYKLLKELFGDAFIKIQEDMVAQVLRGLKQYTESSSFIEDIVENINNKQLKPGGM